MLRDNLLYALYEEITGTCTSYDSAEIFICERCEYLTADEQDCLLDMIDNYFEV